MAVYFITGKLGSGKTLVTIGKIRDYLKAGRRVATNININTEKMFSKIENVDLIRLPDKPTSLNMIDLGQGYEGDDKNESKYGLIVLDELGTWFNTRGWNEKGQGAERKALLDWCRHARKLRWDVMFIVQDISVVDSQLRSSLCEHLVICIRSDRLRLFGLAPPKWHKASVYYGDTDHKDMRVQKWLYMGKELYPCYDTEQVFADNEVYEGISSVLPLKYTKRYLDSPKKPKYQKYLTKSNLALITLVFLNIFLLTTQNVRSDSKQQKNIVKQGQLVTEEKKSTTQISPKLLNKLPNQLEFYRVSGEILKGKKLVVFVETNQGVLTSDDLRMLKIRTTRIGHCRYKFLYRSAVISLGCHSPGEDSLVKSSVRCSEVYQNRPYNI